MKYDNAWLQNLFERQMPMSGYGPREEQLGMANYVHTALTKGRHLLAEAGVGTGKTFAYLIPLLAHWQRTGQPAVIATHTIALQEQLVNKDIPAVCDLVGLRPHTLLAKGKDHYLCRMRLNAFASETTEPTPEQAKLISWGQRTMTGDRAQSRGVADALWKRVNWGEEGPCTRQCRLAATCPSQAVRQRWREAEGLIVTNHHQFFADLALRAQGRHLFALPGAMVLDEAHSLPDAAREILGQRARVAGLAAALKGALSQVRPGGPDWRPLVDAGQAFTAAFARAVVSPGGRESADDVSRYGLRPDAELARQADAIYNGASRLLAQLEAASATPGRVQAIDRLSRAIGPLRGLINAEDHVTWAEGNPGDAGSLSLVSAPRDLGAILRTRLFGRQVPVILTSATLAPGGDFGPISRELGLDSRLACAVGSPFDFERQARLYLPNDLPDPGVDPDVFYLAAIERLAELLTATRGRALVLFTAKRRAQQAFKALSGRLPFPVYLQDRGDPELLARFALETHSVLLGTGYWEGIDVPGEALSCVVVVKLPFSPDDPLVASREAQATAAGLDPFEAVRLPDMLLKLRQGVGRLIRREGDRGVIAVLDPRAVTRERYCEEVREALPEAPEVTTLEALATFLAADVSSTNSTFVSPD